MIKSNTILFAVVVLLLLTVASCDEKKATKGKHTLENKKLKENFKNDKKINAKHVLENKTSKQTTKHTKKHEVKPVNKDATKDKKPKKETQKDLKSPIKVEPVNKDVAKDQKPKKETQKDFKNPMEVDVTIKKETPSTKQPLPHTFSLDETEVPKEGEEESNATEGEEDLKCNKAIDLVIALDSSESVREANWTKLLRFTKGVVKSLDPTTARVGVIRYNTIAEIPVPLEFFQNAEAFSTTLDNVFYEPGGTRTDVALSKALVVFASSGRRRASKVLLVVTDNPTNDIRIAKDNLVVGKDLVEKPSKDLKRYEVITFAVGVNYALTETEKEDLNEELKMITQDEEGDRRIVEVEDFEELLKSENNLAGKVCLVNGGWSTWTAWSQCTNSCGGGTKVRSRRCDNPKPANNGSECTEHGGSHVETSTCNIYPCEGIELTSLSQPARAPSGASQNILFSKDCPNGFDYVYVNDNQMSASSVYTKNTGDSTIMKFHAPGNGKLYNVMNAGAWCAEHAEAAANHLDQYIQIDLKIPVKIAKVGTQGQESYLPYVNNWVTFFKFNYSEDGRTWKQYNKTFTGNSDGRNVRENLITPPVTARYVRFNPVHWYVGHDGIRAHDICMRVGVFTCTEVKKTSQKKSKRTLIQPRKYRPPFWSQKGNLYRQHL